MEEIIKLLQEAEELAKKEKIPFFAAVTTENNENTTEYNYYHVTPFYANKALTKDYISPMLLVINGFPIKKDKKVDVEGLITKVKTGLPARIQQEG